ncbi:MAG: hypothetical protein H8M99_06070 [Gloeobacteraceae cyanobacterium ES-bin-144]|nr:hypothetical protein [Verrucomicrobiales bacterium]
MPAINDENQIPPDRMLEKRNHLGRMAMGVLFAVAICFQMGCHRFEQSGFPGSASSMARNHIMFVRKSPQTFGYYRLTSLTQAYPELALFVQNRGAPDFLAETSNRGRNYFILYYLKPRQAFVSRSRLGGEKGVEFAGPYPITRKEYQTLNGLRGADTNRIQAR